MVSNVLLSIIILFPQGPSDSEFVDRAKAITKYAFEGSGMTEEQVYGWKPPKVERQGANVRVILGHGSVSFLPSGRPTGFLFYTQVREPNTEPLDPGAVIARGAGMTAKMFPTEAFQYHYNDATGEFQAYLLEQGIPHWPGITMSISRFTGRIGAVYAGNQPFPILRLPNRRIDRDEAIAASYLSALETDPTLDLFELERAILLWMKPGHDSERHPPHVRQAFAQGKSVAAWHVYGTAQSRAESNPWRARRHGGFYIDAETGRPFMGGYRYIEGASGSAAKELGRISRVEKVFSGGKWLSPELKSTDRLVETPKGDKALAMQGNRYANARYDAKSQVLWIAEGGKWREFAPLK